MENLGLMVIVYFLGGVLCVIGVVTLIALIGAGIAEKNFEEYDDLLLTHPDRQTTKKK